MSYQQSAARHFRDGIVLYDKPALENADQLFGLAAECAIKYALRLIGESQPFVHIDQLWERALPGKVARQFETLSTILRTFRPNPWANWRIEQRYSPDGHVPAEIVASHRDMARRVCGAVQLLGVRTR